MCWGPYVVQNLWAINNDQTRVPYLVDMTTTLLAFSNSAVNPFVFIFLTRDFRFAVRMLLRRCLTRLEDKDAVTQTGSRRPSHQGDSVDTVRIGGSSRGSLDSGVDIDGDHNPRDTASNRSSSLPPGLTTRHGSRLAPPEVGRSHSLPNGNAAVHVQVPCHSAAGGQRAAIYDFRSGASSSPMVIISHSQECCMPTIVVPGQVE